MYMNMDTCSMDACIRCVVNCYLISGKFLLRLAKKKSFSFKTIPNFPYHRSSSLTIKFKKKLAVTK